MIRSTTPSIVRRTLIAVVAAVAVLGAACTADDPVETTTTTAVEADTTTTTADTSNDPLVFGNGEIPETVPEGFPIPEEGRVGATMIDRVNGVTELVVVYPAQFEDVIDYFETNIPATGYAIDSSEGTQARWTISFSGPASGEVFVETAGSGVTQGLIRFTGQADG